MSGLESLDLSKDLFRTHGELELMSVETPRGRDGPTRKDLFCVPDGEFGIYQGDIRLRRAAGPEIPKFLQSILEGFGLGVNRRERLWTNGMIPFTCNAKIRPLVDRAIGHWMSLTPLRFFPRENEESDFVAFTTGEGVTGSSAIGRAGGISQVYLREAATQGDAIHEIGHVVGLWHEQARPDWEKHIKIDFGNIREGDRPQFQPLPDTQLLGVYDILSIMHYPSFAFAIDENRPTITQSDGSLLPPRNGLSAGDIDSVRQLYPQLEWK